MTSAPPEIECFYTLSSPWAYFGGPRLLDIARKHGVPIVLRPYDFVSVVPRTGGIPLRTRPQPRRDYHALELDRWRKFLGMPLNLKPRFYPPDNRLATHAVIAAQQAGLAAVRLSHAILQALWADERNSADRATLIAIAHENGIEGEWLFAAATDAPVDAEFERNSLDAVARGVFGSPTYYFAGVPYWGQDRLDFLDRALTARAEQL
ncbi:MAG: 2-hydroxychromene-2-carboxylate isomerase [Burkholderiales bacterium]